MIVCIVLYLLCHFPTCLAQPIESHLMLPRYVGRNTDQACEPAVYEHFRARISLDDLHARSGTEEASWERVVRYLIQNRVFSTGVFQIGPRSFTFSCKFRQWQMNTANPMDDSRFLMECEEVDMTMYPGGAVYEGRVIDGVGICAVWPGFVGDNNRGSSSSQSLQAHGLSSVGPNVYASLAISGSDAARAA